MATRLDTDDLTDDFRLAVELGSDDPLDHLRGLRSAERQLDVWQREAIARARTRGDSWADIGDALGVTKQAAWELYSRDVREMLATARRRSGLGDDEAQRLADHEREQLRSVAGG